MGSGTTYAEEPDQNSDRSDYGGINQRGPNFVRLTIIDQAAKGERQNDGEVASSSVGADKQAGQADQLDRVAVLRCEPHAYERQSKTYSDDGNGVDTELHRI